MPCAEESGYAGGRGEFSERTVVESVAGVVQSEADENFAARRFPPPLAPGEGALHVAVES